VPCGAAPNTDPGWFTFVIRVPRVPKTVVSSVRRELKVDRVKPDFVTKKRSGEYAMARLPMQLQQVSRQLPFHCVSDDTERLL
jgi:hypothetical protein